MGVRNRISVFPIKGPGEAIYQTAPGLIGGPWSAITRTSRCSDEVDGTRNPHALTIEHSHRLLYSISGHAKANPNNHWLYNGYPGLDIAVTQPASQPAPSVNTSLSMALARTNPNRPTSDVLGAIVELKDVPAMVRNHWQRYWKGVPKHMSTMRLRDLKRIPKDAGDLYLTYEFGIAPMIRDFQTLLDFQGNVEKKLNTLRNMRDKGSTGGRAVAYEDRAESAVQWRYLTTLYQETNQIEFKWVTTRKNWVTVNWIPTTPLPPPSEAADEALARRLAYGQGVTLHTLWNLMPWSWLIDWFSSVGDIMSLTRNALPVRHSGSCFMSRTSTHFMYVGQKAGPGKFSLTPSQYPQYDLKTRSVLGDSIPLPEFNLPFLNGKQLGILSALTATRTVR